MTFIQLKNDTFIGFAINISIIACFVFFAYIITIMSDKINEHFAINESSIKNMQDKLDNMERMCNSIRRNEMDFKRKLHRLNRELRLSENNGFYVNE
jgi:hypothetical protein